MAVCRQIKQKTNIRVKQKNGVNWVFQIGNFNEDIVMDRLVGGVIDILPISRRLKLFYEI